MCFKLRLGMAMAAVPWRWKKIEIGYGRLFLHGKLKSYHKAKDTPLHHALLSTTLATPFPSPPTNILPLLSPLLPCSERAPVEAGRGGYRDFTGGPAREFAF
jgi:hypothetical protein